MLTIPSGTWAVSHGFLAISTYARDGVVVVAGRRFVTARSEWQAGAYSASKTTNRGIAISANNDRAADAISVFYCGTNRTILVSLNRSPLSCVAKLTRRPRAPVRHSYREPS